MSDFQSLSCSCGRTEWQFKGGAAGRHIQCYCADCQTFANHLGQTDRHLENGGTKIFQTCAADVSFTRGEENVALLRLGPKGLFRWYAKCCNTPIANTMPNGGLAFAGLILPTNNKGFGPVRAHVNTGTAAIDIKQTGFAATVAAIFKRAIKARFTGRSDISPFFKNGAPIVEPIVISKEQRQAARPKQMAP